MRTVKPPPYAPVRLLAAALILAGSIGLGLIAAWGGFTVVKFIGFDLWSSSDVLRGADPFFFLVFSLAFLVTGVILWLLADIASK